MADVVGVDAGVSMGQRMAQKARAGLPFNPLTKADIAGGNIIRLQLSMKSYGWTDPRFVTREQVLVNNWSIAPGSVSVKVFVPGAVEMATVFNAGCVIGMPSLETMVAMSDAQLLKLKGFELMGAVEKNVEDMVPITSQVAPTEVHVVPESLEGEPEDGLVISQGMMQSLPLEDGAKSAGIGGVDAPEKLVAAPSGPARFAVMAPYWNANGLHNAEGVAAASALNRTILERKLSEDRDAIGRLMSLNEKARLLGLAVVPEAQYVNDPDLKRDAAHPGFLLGGDLVRDKDGSYHPKEGGRAVLHDKGDSLVLKNKSEQAFRGVMELAVAKGWTAIELKGKAAALSEAWIEAKLMGLDVINYKPNEKDMEKFEARLALDVQRKAAFQQGRAAEQAPELVVEQAFVNDKGLTEFAKLTYTVSYQGGADQQFDNPGDAARAFAGSPASALPVVVRSVVRADGEVIEGVVSGVAPALRKGGVAQVLESVLDREFDEAMQTIIDERDVLTQQGQWGPTVTTGPHSGVILEAKGGRLAQDAGQGRVVWHDVANLRGQVPKVGQRADIQYANGLGRVKAKELESGVER